MTEQNNNQVESVQNQELFPKPEKYEAHFSGTRHIVRHELEDKISECANSLTRAGHNLFWNNEFKLKYSLSSEYKSRQKTILQTESAHKSILMIGENRYFENNILVILENDCVEYVTKVDMFGNGYEDGTCLDYRYDIYLLRHESFADEVYETLRKHLGSKEKDGGAK